jgi:L-ascorbate metabolism protein UlaG (beta-lactamase superfamily)
MTISNYVRSPAIAASVLLLASCASTSTSTSAPVAASTAQPVGIQQIRNATMKVDYAGTTFLIDPLLAEREVYPGFPGTLNDHLRWPRVGLPITPAQVLQADAVIITHIHSDHWDDAAKQALPKNMPIFAQNEADAQAIRLDGFTDVRVLGDTTEFNGTRLIKTEGQHYTDDMAPGLKALLGATSGIVFQRPGHETVYVAGDTIWTPQVESAIRDYRPDVIVLNTAYARVQGYDRSIIMGKEDLLRAHRLAPSATILGIHMDTINHAAQTRRDLIEYIAQTGMDRRRVLVPQDGETYRF